MLKIRIAGIALLFAAASLILAGAEPPALLRAKTFFMTGVTGRFDHFALDAKGHRVFVAALGNNSVEAIDPEAGLRIQSISGLGKPTGVLFLPALDRLFVACGDDGAFRAFEGRPLRPVQSLTGLDDADNVRYDAQADLIYLGFGAGALAVIRPAPLEKIGEIKLPGHPESFQLEKGGVRIFVNVPDAKQVVVIDRKQRKVMASWPMPAFRENFPMALDETNHRLFLGCRKPARLVVLDTSTGARVADLRISDDIDDLFYDVSRSRLYASCGQGYLDVITQLGANSYKLRERIATASGARTSLLSPDSKNLFLAVPDRGRQRAEVRVFEIR